MINSLAGSYLKNLAILFLVVSLFFGFSVFVSMPRYEFEDSIQKEFKNRSEWKLVSFARHGSLSEPLTLFDTPIGNFIFVMPLSYDFGATGSTFLRTSINYELGQQTELVEVWCEDKKIRYAAPDGKFQPHLNFWGQETGYKYTSEDWQDMNSQLPPHMISMNDEIKIYCNTDYSKELKIYHCKKKILSQLSNITIEAEFNADVRCRDIV